MSNYKTHVSFNLFLTLPISLAALYYRYSPENPLIITFVSAFIYSTCFMNPDLDLVHQIRLFSLRGILTLPFRFYSKVFRHRGLSHSLFFGTATRIAWLSALGLLIFYLIYETFPSEKRFLYYFKDYKYYLFYALAGIVLADWSHLALDYRKLKKL